MSALDDFFPESFKDDFVRRNLKIGTVLKLHLKNTNQPKEKRVIVVGKTIDGVCLATVFINSAINPNINFPDELRQLHCFFPAEVTQPGQALYPGRLFLHRCNIMPGTSCTSADRPAGLTHIQ